VSSIHLLKAFDKSQLWRFFVDGRFQKKYDGWVGYEAGERGSIQALLNGFSYMLDHFDLSSGLNATYLRELHKICMLNVETSNLKSSPGDIRYLNSGMPFFAKSTTYEHLVEVFSMRHDDGTSVFNSQKYGKTANELDVDEVYAYMQKEGKINYRNWYPNLDKEQQQALEGKATLHEFYQAKHSVQMLIVAKMEAIIERYNRDIQYAKTDDEKLAIIALVPRELELLHPFPDGNSRTFSCITLLHLLLYNGLTPTLLDNPNLDNEVSLGQWINEIKQGQQRMQDLLIDKNARVFNYSILDMAAENKQAFNKMSEGLNAKIAAQREIFLTPKLLQAYTGGEWQSKNSLENLRFTGVGTYGTYALGNIYFAVAIKDWLKEGKDVAAELHKVLAKGMRALVIDDIRYANLIDIPILLVEDSFAAFKQASIQVRQAHNPFTVLVTGTEGKTGAKVQFHHLLNGQVKTHAVLNSANTEVPVLRSLINLEPDDQVEINEVSVGSDEAYRVERAQMVNPNLCFFTNIGPNHMDMHKNIENIMCAKSSVVEGLTPDGRCIVNSTIEHYPKLLNAIYERRKNTPILTYGTLKSDNATLLLQTFDSERFGWQVQALIEGESVNYFLPLFQQHAPLTSVGILLAVKIMGYDLQQAAASYQGLVPFETMGRMLKLHKRSGDIHFYDQSRRGGLHGMRSAFADMKNFKVKGKIVALVGGISIKKDSEWTQQSHTELANMINESQIGRLYTTGQFMSYVTDKLEDPSVFVQHSDDLDDLALQLFSELQGGDMLFIIGSAYLYLGRVADRLLRLKDQSKFDYKILDLDLNATQVQEYRALVSMAEIEKGNKESIVLKNNVLDASYYHNFVENKDFTQMRAQLVQHFLTALDDLFSHCGFRNVSADIANTGGSNFVLNSEFCAQWFNNLDKNPSLPRKQLFGYFYAFDNTDYLLHIELATMNLHIGLVKYTLQDGLYKALKMTEKESVEVITRYSSERPLKFEYRSWGLRWCSYDCGKFIDPTRAITYGTMVALEQSTLKHEVLDPLLAQLSA